MSDDPRGVVYLSAPRYAETALERLRNRNQAAAWAAWLTLWFPIAIECSWVALWGALDETESNRLVTLRCDLKLVARCDELFLVGGRVTTGMRIEADFARERGMRVVDLTSFGIDPPDGILDIRKAFEAARSLAA